MKGGEQQGGVSYGIGAKLNLLPAWLSMLVIVAECLSGIGIK
jgi:hypothetical protein